MKKFPPYTFSLLAIVWAGFILFATLASGHTLSKLNFLDLFAYDKPIHAFLFGSQAWLIIQSWKKPLFNDIMKTVLMACLMSTGYGILTEFLQGLFVLQGRNFDYYDMIGDAFGCLFVYAWYRYRTTYTSPE